MKCSFSFYPTFMLLLWVVVVISSLSFFGYVLSRPSLALWVEGVQPSGAYRHGKERLAAGEFEDALAAFRKGQAYFQRLYRESGLERMQVQWAVGLLLEANAYKDRGLGMDKEEAIRLFKAVVEVAPYLSEGQAC
ncbi:MAG: hypothetical protein RBU29_12645, partial [bacterium]|nr:hypothetical protein [bacterium]